jgi:hypothetical protein
MAAASGRDQARAALRHLDVAIAAIGGRPPAAGRHGQRAARARLLATAGDDGRHWPPSAPATGRGRRWRRSCWAG